MFTPMMTLLNYILAIAFTIVWAVGFFMHWVGYHIHILLIAAFTLILINILNNHNRDNDPKYKHNR